MSGLTGLINRAVSTTPGWSASSMLPIQQRVGPAPPPVEGTDESGRKQAFVQPRLALGVPEAIAAPVHSLVNSADATARGEAPTTEDLMRVLLTSALPSLGGKASDEAMMSAGARTFRAYKGMHPYADEPARNFKGDVVGPETTPRPITDLTAPTDHPHAGYFSSDPAVASRFAEVLSKNGAVFPADVTFHNPIEIDAKGNPAAAFQFESVAREHDVKDQYKQFQDALKSPHHDGIILKNTADEGTVFVPRNAEQIRPAFDGLINRPNITPASIASEHALDMAAIDRLAAQDAAKPKRTK